MELKYLSEEQNAQFDREYHSAEEIEAKLELLRRHFPGGPRSILDVGGGNGRFLDGLLDAFPQADGVLLDISQHLLDANTPNPRKTLINASVNDADRIFAGRKFDLITINWLLHHLVGPTYQACADNCVATLRICQKHLAPNGVIFIAENMFEGFLGLNMPSHVIYSITRVKFPPFVRQARRFFNTAGVGVCFRNERNWGEILARAGLKPSQVLHKAWPDETGYRRVLRTFLGYSHGGHAHFFCPAPAKAAE